jgi:hypothetical protein
MPKRNFGPEPVSSQSQSALDAKASSFDAVVKALGLAPKDFLGSAQLKAWVKQNKDHKYVPPDLLKAWGLVPDLDL